MEIEVKEVKSDDNHLNLMIGIKSEMSIIQSSITEFDVELLDKIQSIKSSQ
jgi:hypothetical protein